jgi:putative ABC transport system permease protein
MSRPRWRKVLRDLWLHLPRTLLVILAITLGIFGVGAFLDAYAIITPTIETNFTMTNPAAATLRMESVDSKAVQIARHFSGVTGAEARRTVYARVEVGPDEWGTLTLFVISDFKQVQVNKFWRQAGSWPPGEQQILIERASIPLIHKTEGSRLVVKLSDGAPRELPIVGTVYDPGQAPAWVDGVAYGYITPGTLQWLGGPSAFDDLLVTFNREDSSQQIHDEASRLAGVLQQDGYRVQWVHAAIPEHPHTDQMNSFLFLLEAFGVLCLLLSGILTATLISALLGQQMRQIGVMKAIGACTSQVMGLYMGDVLIFSVVALILAIPLGVLAGQGFASVAASLLNFNIMSMALPWWVYLVQVGLGMLVPLLTASYPIYRGSRMSVHEAMSDYGVALEQFGSSRFDMLLGRIESLSRPLVLSLRNAFRRRVRMVLTLLMLAAGGTSFMAALGAAASWTQTIDDAFASTHYDVDIRFDQPYAASALEKSIRAVAGVSDVEIWGGVAAVPQYADGSYGNGNLFRVLTPPAKGTTLSPPLLIAGRWLEPGDTDAVVLNDAAAEPDQGPQVHVGDKITLYLNGSQKSVWHVVGIVREFVAGPSAYANASALAAVTHQQGLAERALIVVKNHDQTLQTRVVQELEQRLAADGFHVEFFLNVSFEHQVLSNHVIIMKVLLMVVAVLMLGVGALGLASTMSVNVMERTREIGMMRAIGASTQAIMQIVIGEGIALGLLSWLLGDLVSLPVTAIVSSIAGEFFLHMPLHLVIPAWIPLLWLGIVVVVAVVASFAPAWSAARLTVREVLAYE